MESLQAHKNAARAMWATGDYDRMMTQEGLYAIGQRLADSVRITADDTVLDIACGTGNAAIPAATLGARVTGLDLTPSMLNVARKRADVAGVTIDFMEGDAEDLPFDDHSFDVVLSTFGCMFAPRHQIAASEIIRVLRCGGRLGLCTWTIDGSIGDFFRTVGPYLPQLPEFADPPLLWGDPDHIQGLFHGTGFDLTFRRETWLIEHESTEAAVDCYVHSFGPVILEQQLAVSQQRAESLLADLGAMIDRHNVAGENRVQFPAEYLVTLGHSPC